jgi:ribosomal protein S27E
MKQCPGQNPRNWTSEDIFDVRCPKCGNLIEFFRDDQKRPCKKCETVVLNPKLNIKCLEWCSFADRCGIGIDVIKEENAMT